MNDQDFDDIDYEHLDDLPLPEHIEWNHIKSEEEEKEDEEDPLADDWPDD